MQCELFGGYNDGKIIEGMPDINYLIKIIHTAK